MSSQPADGLAEILERVDHAREGLGRWHELAQRLTAADTSIDAASAGFLLWSIGSLAESLAAIDDELEELLASPPGSNPAARARLKLIPR